MVETIEATRGADGKLQVTQGRLAAKAALAARVRELQDQMEEHTVIYHVVGMPFAEYNAVLLDHPPREGNMVDRALGYNVATFHPAIVRKSVKSPDLSDDARWERTVAVLADGDFDALASAANEVNRRLDDGRVPFSQTAYAETSDLEETSSSPDASE
jgi:hypothetical protein